MLAHKTQEFGTPDVIHELIELQYLEKSGWYCMNRFRTDSTINSPSSSIIISDTSANNMKQEGSQARRREPP